MCFFHYFSVLPFLLAVKNNLFAGIRLLSAAGYQQIKICFYIKFKYFLTNSIIFYTLLYSTIKKGEFKVNKAFICLLLLYPVKPVWAYLYLHQTFSIGKQFTEWYE